MTLRIGQKAPDFEVRASDGRLVRLGDFVGKKNVVLYFYPKDFTSVCTRETCGFRDAYEELRSTDTEVLGVSADSDESHQKFASAHAVPFQLVADERGDLAKKYDAKGLLGGLIRGTSRVTYVIDKKGEVAGVFSSLLNAAAHVDGVRDLVKRLG